MRTPKLICFDLGGVLVRLNPAFFDQFRSWAEPAEVQNLDQLFRDDFRLAQRDHSANERYQLGQLSSDEFVSLVRTTLGNRISKEQICTALLKAIAGENSETTRLLAPLARVARLGCFSNTYAVHWDYMNSTFPWMKSFEIKLASHLCGSAKPTAAAFQSICDAAAIQPAQCLFIDDRAVNIDGARAFGMQARLYSSPHRLIEELREFGISISHP